MGGLSTIASSCRLRFELVGDSVLNFITTTLIQELYPGLHVGPFTVSWSYFLLGYVN
jgi:dsRNA-specific ribonuclease